MDSAVRQIFIESTLREEFSALLLFTPLRCARCAFARLLAPAPLRMAATNTIIGIDPGLAACGIAVIRKRDQRSPQLLYTCHLTTKPKTPFVERLDALATAVRGVIRMHSKIDGAVIEETFFGRGTKASLKLANARGALIAAVTGADIPLAEVAPSTMKRLIGGPGCNEKFGVERAVRKTLKIPDEQRLTPDQADAMGIALSWWLMEHGN